MDAILGRVQTDWIDPDAEWSMMCLLTDAVGFPQVLPADNDIAQAGQFVR
jgi:hypothetical protein